MCVEGGGGGRRGGGYAGFKVSVSGSRPVVPTRERKVATLGCYRFNVIVVVTALSMY